MEGDWELHPVRYVDPIDLEICSRVLMIFVSRIRQDKLNRLKLSSMAGYCQLFKPNLLPRSQCPSAKKKDPSPLPRQHLFHRESFGTLCCIRNGTEASSYTKLQPTGRRPGSRHRRCSSIAALGVLLCSTASSKLVLQLGQVAEALQHQSDVGFGKFWLGSWNSRKALKRPADIAAPPKRVIGLHYRPAPRLASGPLYISSIQDKRRSR